MNHANLYLGRGRVVAPYVASGTLSQGAEWRVEGGQAGQEMGLPGGRSCLLSASALCWPWASAAKWL